MKLSDVDTNTSHISLDAKQASLAFEIMQICEKYYPEEDEFKENIPVLELLYKSSVVIEGQSL